MTTTKTNPTRAEAVANMEAAKVEMDAKMRSTCVGNYVLSWNNCLFVGINHETGEAYATGYVKATVFGDRRAAIAWQRRHQIRNGHGEFPVPVRAFNAGQGAIASLEEVIHVLSD